MPSEIGGGDADKSEFDAPTERMTTITPLLYQSGYITIKGYDPETDLYRLDIPNKEIRVGLYRSLLPNYIGMNTVKGTTTIAKMSALIRRGDMDGALKMLQAYIATVPYCSNADSEGHYQQMMYVISPSLTITSMLRCAHRTAVSIWYCARQRISICSS